MLRETSIGYLCHLPLITNYQYTTKTPPCLTYVPPCLTYILPCFYYILPYLSYVSVSPFAYCIYLPRIYIDALELYLESSRLYNSLPHYKAYAFSNCATSLIVLTKRYILNDIFTSILISETFSATRVSGFIYLIYRSKHLSRINRKIRYLDVNNCRISNESSIGTVSFNWFL